MGSMFAQMAAGTTTTQLFKVLVVGGSYGGLSAALNLQDLCHGRAPRCGPTPAEGEPVDVVKTPQCAVDITIVDERDGFCLFTPPSFGASSISNHSPDHTIGSPLALASESYAQKCWVKYDEIPALRSPNIRVLQGTMQSVNQSRKVATYVKRGGTETSELQYDYFVAAAGLRRVWPVVPQSLRKKQYLFEVGDHIRATTKAKHGVVVVGGGKSPNPLLGILA
jgi:NADH dehydrogenase FAD-containing subunit